MILRIMTEGQYELDDTALAALDDMDDTLLDALAAGDEQAFKQALEAVVQHVQARGRRLAASELRESDLILPPPDVTLSEARALFAGYPRDLIK